MESREVLQLLSMERNDIELRYLEGPGFNAPIHAHPFYEIYFFLEGPVERYVVGGRSYRLRPGDILMLPTGVPHHPVFHEEANQYRRYLLWLSEEFLQACGRMDPDMLTVLDSCREQESYRIRCKTAASRKLLEDILTTMWREEQTDALCKRSSLLSLCARFLVQLNRITADEEILVPKNHRRDSPLDKILNYIHNHYTEAITLNQVAEHFYTSPSSIEVLLRNQAGKPFYRYVTECRIIHAQTLIVAGMPLKEVGTACGYNDYSNFYRAFTREVGVSPSDYRKLTPTNQYQVSHLFYER